MKAQSQPLRIALNAIAISLLSITAVAEIIVRDSFESGDMSASGADGFSWARNNRTSVVSDSGVLWNNGPKHIDIPSGRDWTAYTGDNSLRFRYPAGVHMAEQRFSLDHGLPELWISFWLRVPENFHHPTGNNNQKLFAIWMDEYEFSGQGATVVWQFRRSTAPEAGEGGSISRLYHIASRNGQSQRHSGEASGTGVLISSPSDHKRWMEVVFRVVASSEFDSRDGIAQMWRRWEGESAYQLLHDERDLMLGIPPDSHGFKAGYLMGWANASYSADTEFLIDEFVLSSSTLLGAKPNPPSNVLIVE